MADETPAEDRAQHRRHRARRRMVLRAVALGGAAVVLLSGGLVSYLYVHLNGNIHGIDLDRMLGRDRPAQVDDGTMDILVLGSDSRSGPNARYGSADAGARSDTAMIVHLHHGHRKATVVSIPRDTLVDRPDCAKPGGGTEPAATRVMFNEAYALGGPACAVRTVEAMTGIRMDHYMEVDFTGFKHLVDALGGVPVTTARAIHDTSSRLDLPAGTHTLDGEQALGLVRTRHAVADGSDLARIQLQQAFVKALMDRVNRLGLLNNPTTTYGVADSATKALTTDSGLASVAGLVGLAESMKGLGSHDLSMVTLPVRYSASDPNRVEPVPAQAEQVWRALRADRPVPASATAGTAGADVQGAKGILGSGVGTR